MMRPSSGAARTIPSSLASWRCGRAESVRRIRIVSPFWSEATDSGPLPLLLRALRKRGAEVEGAAVTLVCAAAPDTVTTWAPALPASYAAYNFGELGVNVRAVAARPGVDVEERAGAGSYFVPV